MSIADYNEALNLCEDILELIEDEIPDAAWDKASDFFEDIKEKVESVQENIESNERATAAQITALRNWKSGVCKWIRSDDDE